MTDKNSLNFYYLAFGANMNKKTMKDRCGDDIEFIGKAEIQDFKFIIDTKGVASVIESKGDFVEGILWNISLDDVHKLDFYEGTKRKDYYKKFLNIEVKDIEVRAFFYVAYEKNIGKTDKNYLIDIIKQSKDNNFKEEYINHLESFK